MHDSAQEALVAELNDAVQLAAYRKPYDHFPTSFLPRVLGTTLVSLGNFIYGFEPSYLKFRAIEVIARVPYHSWESAIYTLLTLFYTNEHRAITLGTLSQFARFAQDNETMHVVVIFQLAKRERKSRALLHTVIPMVFAFFYFWAAYVLYLVSVRQALELNYIFEQHAFDQYSRFLEREGEQLKKKPVASEFLDWYGRTPKNQFEFFQSVRNDELIHRNRSIREIELHQAAHLR